MKQVGTVHRWAVVFVEYGDSVDGKGRVMGLYRTKEDAKTDMVNAAHKYMEDLALEDIEIHGDSASVGSTDECGCEYSIQELEFPVVCGHEEVTHEASITIPAGEYRKWDDLIRSPDSEKIMDFCGKGACVATWKTDFDNGYSGEIRVIVDNECQSLYAEAVLYDGCGTSVAFTPDPSYDLDGEWFLYAGDDKYVIRVYVGK